MNTAFFVAFGGPVLLGLIGLAVVILIEPRSPQASPEVRDETLGATLADAEKSARLAADGIARVRAQMAMNGERR